jgi:hypothetical protein
VTFEIQCKLHIAQGQQIEVKIAQTILKLNDIDVDPVNWAV